MPLHAAATCVVATQYKAQCTDDAKNEVCLLVCCCDKFPYQPKKYKLKQLCVDRLMVAKKTNERGILPEVPFNMTKTPPEVIRDSSGNIMSSIPRWRKIFTGEEREGWLKTYGEDKSKKPIRIPDVVVLDKPNGSITQDNIKKIYEIKFPPDDWKEGQKEDYQEIAGKPLEKVEKIGPEECNCDKQDLKSEPATEAARKQANNLAMAADKKLREFLQEVNKYPLSDFEFPDAVELWQDMRWNDFAQENPVLAKAAYPAMLALGALAAMRGGRVPTMRLSPSFRPAMP